MSEVGFLEQCVKLNKFLAEAHEIAARIVGRRVQGKDVAPSAEYLTDRLDDLIRAALDDAQDLIGRLNQIAVRFEGDGTTENVPRQ